MQVIFKKRPKFINKVLYTFLLLFSFITTIDQRVTPTSAWSGPQTSTAGNYYAAVGSETGEALRNKLKTITNGAQVSYDWSRYEAADEAEGVSDSVLLIYSRQVVKKSAHVSGSTGWNREHTYPQSKIGSPATSDNHHIFADDNKTNSIRGNKLFGEVAEIPANKVVDGYGNLTDNYTTSSYFMPNAPARGEVARATMYLNMQYNYAITSNFQSVALMLKWHLENPVSNREIYRNNTVYTLQKNRNPFIDNPQYACLIWGDTNSATQNLCAPSVEVPVSSVSVSPQNQTISLQSANTSLQLSANVLPTNATNKVVSWASSTPSVATVSSTGNVTAKAVGTTTITATSTADGTIKGATTITVTNTPIAVTGVEIIENNMTLNLGKSHALSAVVSPTSATNKNVIWTSSHPQYVSVNNLGLITGHAVGQSVISATTIDGGFTDQIIVTVNEVPAITSVVGEFYNGAGNGESSVNAFTVSNLNNGKTGTYSYSGFGGIEVISEITTGQAYLPRGGGLALGSNNSSGFIKFSVNAEYASKRLEVVFNNAGHTPKVNLYGTNQSGTMTNGTIGNGNPSSGEPYILTFDTAQTYFEIHAEKRLAIVEIRIILEAETLTPLEEATAWANSFLDLTAEGCLTGNEEALDLAWQLAEDEYYDLSGDGQLLIQNSVPNSNGTPLEHARARYEVIRAQYSFNNFIYFIGSNDMGRNTKPPSYQVMFIVLGLAMIGQLGYFTLQKFKRS